MIRENNIKNRTISVFLVISMLVTSLFNSLITMAYAETIEYEKNIGCIATFNTDVYDYFPVSDDPSNLSWNTEYQLIEEDLEEGFKVVITDCHISNNEGDLPCLWYKVEAAPNCEAPEKLIEYPWVFQNYLGEDADAYDSLIIEITEKDNITVIDEEGNEVGEEIELPQYEKKKLIGVSSLSGDVDYQWQILIDDTWIDIYGEDEAEFLLSYGVVATVLDDFQAQIRLTTKKSSKVFEGESITITVIPYEEDELDNEEIREDETTTEPEVHSDDEEFTELTVENDDSNFENNSNKNEKKELNEVIPTSNGKDTNEKKANESDTAITSSADDADDSKSESNSDKTEIEETEEKTETNPEAEESTVSTEITPSKEEDETFLGTLLSMFTMTAYAENGDEENTPEETTETDKVTVTVKYVYGANNAPVDADTVYQIQKGANLNQELSLPVMEGYDAYLEDDTENTYTKYSINLTTITEDKVITFKYWPAKVNYTVIYYWQNAEDDNYIEHERESMSGFTGENTTVEEKEYEGFYRLLYEKVPIASDGSTVIEVYYDRLYYKMIFNLDGGYGVQPIYARYGTPITVSDPTKAGYKFIGWDDITDDSGDGHEDGLPDEVPPYHSEYKAIWEANDNAKVTIVFWGENADDKEYSYLSDYTQEIYAKPGTVINYLRCSLNAHIHSIEQNCYELICDENPHIHSESGCTLMCGHHTIECYTITGQYSLKETMKPENDLTDVENGIYTYTSGNFWNSATHYYLNLNNTWYCAYSSQDRKSDTQKISLSCSHLHTDDCYSCGITENEHVHNLSRCYNRICTVEEHTHTDSCYPETGTLNQNLWTYFKSEPVIVEADGSTVMNVYFNRTTFTLTFRDDRETVATITEKWGASIYEKFGEAPFATTYNGRAWECTDESKYGYALQTLDIMPEFDATFDLYNKSTNTLKNIYYYVENVGANVSENSWPTNTNNFTLLKTVQTYFSYATYEEEYHEIVGFKRYDAGTAGFRNNQKNFSNNALNLYYLRDDFELVFSNGEESVKTERVLYEQPLSGYDFTPEMPSFYEPGSREFAGWYLNPECTGEEFALSEHTMPSEDLLLYAKWIPVTHTVRFYLDKNIDKTDANVYTAVVDGKTIRYMYDVPHGSAVQNPYTPPNDPEKGQYIFVGWFYEDVNGKEQMWDFENSTVTRDVDIYAKWSSNSLVQYTVKFVYKDGDKEIEIAAPITGSALGGNSKTFEAKGNDQLYSNYQEGYFPTTQSHTIVMDLDNPDNNTYTFYYTKEKAVPYTVYFVTDKQNESNNLQDVELNGKTYYIVAPTKVVAENKKAIVTETYAKVLGYLPDTYQQTLIINPKGDNRIIFYYTKDEINGMYVVHYLTENLDGTYTEHSIFEGRGKIGAEVNATIKDIENFTHDSSVNGTKLSGTISKGTVLELNVYYKRNCYPYKVQYLEQNTNKPLSDVKVVKKALWQSIVTEEAITIGNYTIVGNAEKSIQINKDGDTPTVNVITFYYAQNKVSLTIRKKGADQIDENQTFIFKVRGVAGTDTADIDLRVVVKGNGSVTIKDLPIGRYIVEEEISWSWRYEPNEQSYEVELKTNGENEAPFTNNRTKRNWLNGAAYCENLFTTKKETTEEEGGND